MEDEVKLYRLVDEYFTYFSGEISCGNPDMPDSEPGVRVLSSQLFNVNPEEAYVAEVAGDSMIEAGIRKGDKLIIDMQKEAQDGDVVLALVDGGLTLKYLRHDSNGETWLVPANARFQTRRVRFDGENNRIVGVMTSMVRDTPRFDAILQSRLDAAIQEEYRYLRVGDEAENPIHKLIPSMKDKEMVMTRLHEVLDEKGGIELIRYLRAAINIQYLTHMPTYGELTDEFQVDITKSYFYRNKDKEFTDDLLADYIAQLC